MLPTRCPPTALKTNAPLTTTNSYATLPNIMKAKKKPIESLAAADLVPSAADLSPQWQTLSVEEPPKRKAGVMVGSVQELVQKLRDEAGVI